MDILVVGIGGNGQTLFMNYLHQNSFRINHRRDGDGLKHMSCPSKLTDKQKKCKIIYVYNKTFDAICSHFRRKWQITQMKKINNNNNICRIRKIQDFFKLTENSLIDHFGCKNHFLRWFKYDFPNGIYFLNLNNINKDELSKFLNCDISKFDNFIFDSSKRHKYDDLKNTYPISNIMYSNIDNYIDDLSNYKNQKNIN